MVVVEGGEHALDRDDGEGRAQRLVVRHRIEYLAEALGEACPVFVPVAGKGGQHGVRPVDAALAQFADDGLEGVLEQCAVVEPGAAVVVVEQAVVRLLHGTYGCRDRRLSGRLGPGGILRDAGGEACPPSRQRR
ncbi:hypothetical protein ACU686_25685 [Yinghuangia aomiensis]